jgi:outer membrane protein assembly factor BamB
VRNGFYFTLLLFLAIILFAKPLAPFRAKFQRPTIVYESLPTLGEDEQPFYQPLAPSPFTIIKTFKDIFITKSDRLENSLLLIGDTILFAGYIENETHNYGDWTSTNVLSADIVTGQVNWHKKVRGNLLATNGKYVFAEAARDGLQPAGIVAYDIASGENIWQKNFEFGYATFIEFMAVKSPDLLVNTFSQSNYASYVVDMETGEIEQTYHRTMFFHKRTFETLVFRKDEYDYDAVITPIVMPKGDENSYVWRYNNSVVSNIAVGGSVTYFFNGKSELIAFDTDTGKILGMAKFTSPSSENVPNSNNNISVAADSDTVAVYFRDKHQLSLFRFEYGS